MKIALIDYEAGNLHSVEKALMRALREASLTGEVKVVRHADELLKADRILLPGDGAFADCRAHFHAIDGLEEALHEMVWQRARPFLGICVGMQLLADWGEERGETRGLGWIPGRVLALDPLQRQLKVPHMGWNTLQPRVSHPILRDIPLGDEGWHAYFLHSFHFLPKDPTHLIAYADYGGEVTAMIGRDTMVGTQFHPEKSQKLGLSLLRNFLRWSP